MANWDTPKASIINSIETGPQGPPGEQGPPGTGTGSVIYNRLIDTVGVIYYVGEAEFGSAENAAVWRIYKVDFSSAAVKTWAGGNANFTNKWSERLTLSYS